MKKRKIVFLVLCLSLYLLCAIFMCDNEKLTTFAEIDCNKTQENGGIKVNKATTEIKSVALVEVSLVKDTFVYSSLDVIDEIELMYVIDSKEYFISDYVVTCEGKVVDEMINVGEYIISFNDTDSIDFISNSVMVNIIKAKVNLDNLIFNDKICYYDGEIQKILAENIPDEVNYIYYNNDNFLVGNYTVTLKLELKDTYNFEPLDRSEFTANLTIDKAIIDLTKVSFKNKSFEYDGEKKNIYVENLPKEVSCAYSDENLVDVGSYIITATIIYDADKYKVIGDTEYEAVLTITKAKYNLDVTFDDLSCEYDGKIHEIVLNGKLPDGLSVSYVNNVQTNAGVYDCIAKFSSENSNYFIPDDMTAVLTIGKKKLTLSLDNNNFVYTGKPFTVRVNVVGEVEAGDATIEFDNLTNTIAGTHIVNVIGFNEMNYSLGECDLSYVIEKASFNIDHISLESKSIVYSGEEYFPSISGELPKGLSAKLIHDKILNVGKYNIKCEFSANDNYNIPGDMFATIIVNPKPVDVEFSNFYNLVADGSIKNIDVSVKGFLNGDENKFWVCYSDVPVVAGDYVCYVELLDDNYCVSGDSFVEFEILTDSKHYSSDSIDFDLYSEGFSSSLEFSVNHYWEDNLVNKLLKESNIGYRDYEVLSINTNKLTKNISRFDIKINESKIENYLNLKILYMHGDELKEVDFIQENGVIKFKLYEGVRYIFIDAKQDNSLTLILFAFGIFALLGLGVSYGIYKYKSNKKTS